MKQLVIAIPTYNEKENLESLIEEIKSVLTDIPVETTITIIDDTSPDGTGEIADALAKKFHKSPFTLQVIHRKGKQGLGSAYRDAIRLALKSRFDYFLSMDADFSHDPKYIPSFLRSIQENDLVIGSRNVKGGAVEGWSFIRKFVSKGGSLYSRIILGIGIKDLTGGYNMYTRNTLIKMNTDSMRSEGYSSQIEMKYRVVKRGLRVAEIPIVFANRKRGKAKMSTKIFLEAIFRVWIIRFQK